MDNDEWRRIHNELRLWGDAAMTLTFVGIAAFFAAVGARSRELAGTLGVLSLILFCAGLAAWAKRKGQSPVWGLMGLSCLVGVLVLRFLPKRCRSCGEARPGISFDCPGRGAPLRGTWLRKRRGPRAREFLRILDLGSRLDGRYFFRV